MNLFKGRVLILLLIVVVSSTIVSAQTIEQNSSNHVTLSFETKNITQFIAQDITSKDKLIPYGIKNPEELKIPSSINKYDVITIDSKLLNGQLKTGKGITISIGEKEYPAEISRMNFENIDDGIDSYHGIIPGIKSSEILFTTSEKVLIGRITLENETFWIIPVESGEKMEISPAPLHIIYSSNDVTNSKFRIDDGPVGEQSGIPPVNPEENSKTINQKISPNLLQTPLSQTVTVNILVVTDSIYWNNDAWHTEAQSIIAETNLKLSVSDINVQLNPIYDDSRRSQLSSRSDITRAPLTAFKEVYPTTLLDSYGVDIGIYLGGYNVEGDAQGLSWGFNPSYPELCRYSGYRWYLMMYFIQRHCMGSRSLAIMKSRTYSMPDTKMPQGHPRMPEHPLLGSPPRIKKARCGMILVKLQV